MKLNLGCGSKILDGYTNVDKFDYYKPDIVHDLETFPYPFENNSVDEILISHVLEHIGQSPQIFLQIIKEFYRICHHESLIKIFVPHPRHDNFLSDPTHVRPITILGLQLFDKELNLEWQKKNAANTPLALINEVDFKIVRAKYNLDDNYAKSIEKSKIDKMKIDNDAWMCNNVVKEIEIDWLVRKN